MRAFFATFLLSWIIGVLAAAFSWPSVVVSGALVGVVVFVWWQQWPPPFLITVGVLLLLGWVYGGTVPPRNAVPCLPRREATARVVTVQKVTEQTVRYLAQTPDGCRLVLTTGRFPRYNEGDDLSIRGSFEPVAKLATLHPEYAVYLADQGIQLTVGFPEVQVVSDHSAWLASARRAVRQQVEHVFSEPEASLVLAVITGERGTLPEELEQNFRLTGVTHLLSISGFHMSLMVGMLFLLLLLLPLSPWWRTGVALLLMWLYLAFIGEPPAATRAVLFWWATLVAVRLGLLVSLPTVVLFALVAMATYNPHLLQDVGFQLSTLAVIGIGLVMFLARGYLPRRPWLHWLVLSMLVTLGATLTTWPVILYRFGNVSFISPVANLLVQPVFPALMVISLLTLGLSVVSMPVALVGAWTVGLLYDWLDITTRWLAVVPGAAITEATISPLAMYIYYGALLLISALILKWQRRRWREMWMG